MSRSTLSTHGPWKWTCPKCEGSGTFTTPPKDTLYCVECVLAGRGKVEVKVEEVPRGPLN
jgi:DnaJ-class molecular chaperone